MKSLLYLTICVNQVIYTKDITNFFFWIWRDRISLIFHILIKCNLFLSLFTYSYFFPCIQNNVFLLFIGDWIFFFNFKWFFVFFLFKLNNRFKIYKMGQNPELTPTQKMYTKTVYYRWLHWDTLQWLVLNDTFICFCI